MLASERLRSVRRELETVLADVERAGFVEPLKSHVGQIQDWVNQIRTAEQRWRTQIASLGRSVEEWLDERGPAAWGKVMFHVGMWYETADSPSLHYVWALFIERVEHKHHEFSHEPAARSVLELVAQELRFYGDEPISEPLDADSAAAMAQSEAPGRRTATG